MIRPYLLAVAHAAASAVALAQDKPTPEPPPLAAAREEHLRAMQRASVPLLQTYVTKLNGLKQVLGRQGQFEAGVAVDNELREAMQQLEAARTLSDPTKQSSAQLMIVSATYGDVNGKGTVNVERLVKKAMEEGKTSVRVTTDDFANGRDPAPFRAKELKITYIIGGAKKVKSFPEKGIVNFKDDLK